MKTKFNCIICGKATGVVITNPVARSKITCPICGASYQIVYPKGQIGFIQIGSGMDQVLMFTEKEDAIEQFNLIKNLDTDFTLIESIPHQDSEVKYHIESGVPFIRSWEIVIAKNY